MTKLPGLQWTADLDALAGVQITEVDMADAGMTVVREERLLDAATVARLEALPKAERAVAVGRLSRDRAAAGRGASVSERITDGIRRRVEEMLELNEVPADRILSVKRDAVFVLGPPPGRLTLPGGAHFRLKSSYTAFALLGRIELYGVPRRGSCDLKGVPAEKRALHLPYCPQVVLDVLGMVERGDRDGAAGTLRQFREDYVGRRLPAGFYRELNADSAFCVAAGGARFLVAGTGEDIPRTELEIGHNLRNVIVPLARFIA